VSSGESPYRFEQADSCLIISLLPELNEAQWADFERVGNDLLARLSSMQSPAFLVDLSALNYMGSAMVALIVRLWKAAKERKGSMVIVNRHEQVMEVLKLAGLTKLWTIVDSREKGLSALGVSGSVFSGAVGGGGVLAMGVIAVLGAVAGLVLQFSDSAGLGGKIAQAIEFGFAALGLVAGTMMLVREGSAARRNIGIFVLVACVLVVLVGIIAAPTGAAPAGGAPGASLPPANTAPAIVETPADPPPEKKGKKDKDDEQTPATAVASDAAEKAAGDPAAEKKAGEPAAKTPAAAPAQGLKFNIKRDNE
jgi:anti-anti-sigma factor